MKNLSKILNKWSVILFSIFLCFALWSITGFVFNSLVFAILLTSLFLLAAFLIEYLYKKFIAGNKVSPIKIIAGIILFFIFVILVTKLAVFLLNKF